MVYMTAEPKVEWLPRGRPLTRSDLDAMPEDGHRYELIDGVLIVSPAPSTRHQTTVLELAVLLRESCPAALQVFVAPLDVDLAENSVLEPDVLIADRAHLTDRDLQGAPVLAVEVLSPSTRRIDLTLKKARYEAAGCPSYWVIDPLEPSMIAWDLIDGSYVEAGRATGTQAVQLTTPFPIEIIPAALIT